MSIFLSKPKLLLTSLAMAITLTGCGGSGSSGNNSDNNNDDNGNSSTNGYYDETWDLSNDRLIGLARHGYGSDTITILKGTPKDGQDGDIFSVRSAAPGSKVLAEIKNDDLGMDRRDFQDLDTMDDYVVLCKDGSNSPTNAAELHFFKADAPSKVFTLPLTGTDASGNFEMRDCHSIDARFTQGSSTAFSALIYTVGNAQMTSGSPMTNNDRVIRSQLVINTTIDVDAANAITVKTGTDAAESMYMAESNDELAGITANTYGVYFTHYDDSANENKLHFMDTAGTRTEVLSTPTDPFAGVDQQMAISDIAVIEGFNDYDMIYMTSYKEATGIVMAAYDRYGAKPTRTFTKSTDTLTERCVDRLVLKYNGEVGDKMWCHDATNKGNILELNSPVYP